MNRKKKVFKVSKRYLKRKTITEQLDILKFAYSWRDLDEKTDTTVDLVTKNQTSWAIPQTQTFPLSEHNKTCEDTGERSPYRCQLVETGKEFIECHDQLLSCALGGQAGETLDVCKQDTEDERKRWKDGEKHKAKHY